MPSVKSAAAIKPGNESKDENHAKQSVMLY